MTAVVCNELFSGKICFRAGKAWPEKCAPSESCVKPSLAHGNRRKHQHDKRSLHAAENQVANVDSYLQLYGDNTYTYNLSTCIVTASLHTGQSAGNREDMPKPTIEQQATKHTCMSKDYNSGLQRGQHILLVPGEAIRQASWRSKWAGIMGEAHAHAQLGAIVGQPIMLGRLLRIILLIRRKMLVGKAASTLDVVLHAR